MHMRYIYYVVKTKNDAQKKSPLFGKKGRHFLHTGLLPKIENN